MEVLSARLRLTALALALASLAGACSVGAADANKGLAFSHKIHYEDEGLDCSSCHPNFDTEQDPGMPTLPQCMLCHEDIDAEKPPEKQIATLFDGDVYRAQHITALPEEVIFSHPDHALDESLCGTCHVGIETNERLDKRLTVSMDECSKCHENLDIPRDCTTCHSKLSESFPPSTHVQNWQRTHGLVFRAGSTLTANRCDLCHKQVDCNTCHLEVQPLSHTNYWRLRGHGITARMDRSQCYACHRTDICQACHQEVLPQNHDAMWGNTLNKHCLNCHISDTQGGCFVCHTGTPSHIGTPQPPDHTPGMNCLQCHGSGAPLPHVHKGEDCTICHR